MNFTWQRQMWWWFYWFNRRGKSRDLNEQKIIKEPEEGVNDVLTSLSLAVNHRCSLGALITPRNNEMHTQTYTLTMFTHAHPPRQMFTSKEWEKMLLENLNHSYLYFLGCEISQWQSQQLSDGHKLKTITKKQDV